MGKKKPKKIICSETPINYTNVFDVEFPNPKGYNFPNVNYCRSMYCNPPEYFHEKKEEDKNKSYYIPPKDGMYDFPKIKVGQPPKKIYPGNPSIPS